MRRLGLGFLHALNGGFVPSLQALRGFSIGGYVDGINRQLAIPRYAGGGPVVGDLAPASSGKRVQLTLQFPSGQQIDDISIGDIAMQRLQRELINNSLTSNGRRPWNPGR
ncbi:MAG: hypothetical protein EOS36_20175 [Mesorhizobium sp.]|nr:MAG: hypothetical protein EOS36_20175 [Mesorhizobium sp.]